MRTLTIYPRSTYLGNYLCIFPFHPFPLPRTGWEGTMAGPPLLRREITLIAARSKRDRAVISQWRLVVELTCIERRREGRSVTRCAVMAVQGSLSVE